jgi:hypothetical protein
MVHEPLPFAVGQEVLASEQRAARTALPPDARWSCGQVYAKSPAKMNLTNYESD